MKILIPVHLLLMMTFLGFAQSTERILYVVDSIAIIEDPAEDEGAIDEAAIETITVVDDKAQIDKYGYSGKDKVIFIITKEYSKRSVELKKIPTSKNMSKKEGRWHLKAATTPYNGLFIDYNLSGKKQVEGNFKNGKLEGLYKTFYPDGNVDYYVHYAAGIENGESKYFFINGQVREEGVFKNGKDDGIWKVWYSTGQLKRQIHFNEGKMELPKEENKFYSFFNKGIDLFNEGNYALAVKNYDKAIELNSKYDEVYLHRSRHIFMI